MNIFTEYVKIENYKLMLFCLKVKTSVGLINCLLDFFKLMNFYKK